MVPIKISGPLITTQMAYFLTDDSTPKGGDPNINIIDGIHKLKGRTSVNILVSNYTNKHLTFHKGEYIGHLKPAGLGFYRSKGYKSHKQCDTKENDV